VMKTQLADGKLGRDQQQCFTTPAAEEELYDLQADPHSLRNLAHDKSHRLQLLEMRKELDRWRSQTHDEVPASFTPDKYDRTTGKLPVGKEP
jgi:N-sulfoglucosamine sulfohydrolase